MLMSLKCCTCTSDADVDTTSQDLLSLTFGDHTFQPDDVGVVELAHDGCLTQEVPSLALHVAPLQCFNGHGDLLLAWCSQAAAADFAELT